MKQLIPSDKRYYSEMEWLKTYWHFSFDSYFDPDNVSFGALRVFNEDWIKPSNGFPMHPHQDMEIITYVIEGTLEHRDNQGNQGTIREGEVQRMTAGSGIFHSEFNPSPDKECHLLQIWIMPDEKGLKPDWEQKKFNKIEQKDRLLQVISNSESDNGRSMRINQDASFYLSSLSPGKAVSHETEMYRKVYMFIINGTVNVNGIALSTGDQFRSDEYDQYVISAVDQSEFILLDLP